MIECGFSSNNTIISAASGNQEIKSYIAANLTCCPFYIMLAFFETSAAYSTTNLTFASVGAIINKIMFFGCYKCIIDITAFFASADIVANRGASGR